MSENNDSETTPAFLKAPKTPTGLEYGNPLFYDQPCAVANQSVEYLCDILPDMEIITPIIPDDTADIALVKQNQKLWAQNKRLEELLAKAKTRVRELEKSFAFKKSDQTPNP